MRTCPQCKAAKVELGHVCQNCGYEFVDQSLRRPGIVTAYVIISCIIAVAASISGIASGVRMMRAFAGLGWFSVAISGGSAILYCVVGIGLWRLKNWARVVTMILHALGILGIFSSFLSVVRSMTSSSLLYGGYNYPFSPPLMLLVLVVGLCVRGYTIYWFSAHEEYFGRKAAR
jgi:hypothetical protein